ncbi:PREDICTED: 39S ribosomal protein L30, mitochondrial-like [Odobenus rosmarus divergens]|uniref:39S ribosomal protein L30, mitochondrial-like n=1 Tax=Odobenus rosmarus divergens TaxID=9708 RepID=A0A9B0GSG7_ODORO
MDDNSVYLPELLNMNVFDNKTLLQTLLRGEQPPPSRRGFRTLVRRPTGRRQTTTKGVESRVCTDWIHHSFSGSRIPEKVFQPSPADHEHYGADPQPLRKLHIVNRIKSTRRPECGKDTMKMLGLEKAHTPQVHNNNPPGNAKLKGAEHLVTVKPRKLPQTLPAEEAGSSGAPSALHWPRSPVHPEATKS